MWPPAALEFLTELEANNDGEWFRANRARYDRNLLEPGRQVAAAVAHLGQPHFFRPYNNLRFRPGPPLKEHFAVAVGYGGGGGFYFELSLDGLLVAAGIHHPAPDQLERFRAGIDDDRRARRFEQAVQKAQEAGLEPAPPALKRAPKGYPSDHPPYRTASHEGTDSVPPPPARAVASRSPLHHAHPQGTRCRRSIREVAR